MQCAKNCLLVEVPAVTETDDEITNPVTDRQDETPTTSYTSESGCGVFTSPSTIQTESGGDGEILMRVDQVQETPQIQ